MHTVESGTNASQHPGRQVRHAVSNHPVVSGLDPAQAAMYTSEVRALRARIEELEHELEQTRAANNQLVAQAALAAQIAPATTLQPATNSEFAGPTEPAVAPATNPGFAQAWDQESGEDDATFEARFAEKAFFEATSVDEESRSWLLDN